MSTDCSFSRKRTKKLFCRLGLYWYCVNFRQIANNLSVCLTKYSYEIKLSTSILLTKLRKSKLRFVFLKFTLSNYRHKQSKRLCFELANYRFSLRLLKCKENRYVLLRNTICAKSNCEARQKSFCATFFKKWQSPVIYLPDKSKY